MAITMNYTADPVTQPPVHRMNRQRRMLAIVFVISFAMDFKGASGGSLIQYFMAGLNTTAFLLLAASYRMALPRNGVAAFVFWGWAVFFLIATLGAFVNATPLGHYIRTVYPFTLFLEGFLVAWWTTKDPHGARMIVSAMMAAAVVSLFFTAWWGFHFTGKSMGQIRHQMLSPLIPLLIAVAGYDLFFTRQRRIWPLVLLIITLTLIALSVKRTEILIVIFVTGIVLLAAFGNALHLASFPRPFKRVFMWGLFVSVIGVTVATFLYPEVLDRWAHRALGAGHTSTFWTRVAAVIGQFQALIANPFGGLIGQGFGTSYSWPISEFPWILQYVPETKIGRSVWFPGEFMWMSFIYYGGFITGPIAASVLLVGAVRALRLLGPLLRGQSWRIPQARPLWVGVLGYFAFLGMGFTMNPFILRLAALFMGICLGLIVMQGGFLYPAFIQRRTHR